MVPRRAGGQRFEHVGGSPDLKLGSQLGDELIGRGMAETAVQRLGRDATPAGREGFRTLGVVGSSTHWPFSPRLRRTAALTPPRNA
jgi:hypothetical protein